MARLIVTHQTVVEIQVEDFDPDIQSEFWEWTRVEKLYPVFTACAGGHCFHVYWTPLDAAKVLAWFGDKKQALIGTHEQTPTH